jgi:serine/threonine-protein kinase HipA
LNVSLVLPEDTEVLALTLEGKKRNFKRVHFDNFGKGLGLTEKQVSGVFNRFMNNKPKATSWIDQSFLSNDMKLGYKKIVEERYLCMYE